MTNEEKDLLIAYLADAGEMTAECKAAKPTQRLRQLQRPAKPLMKSQAGLFRVSLEYPVEYPALLGIGLPVLSS